VTDATPTEESIAAVEASLDDAAAAPEPQRRARSLSLWNYPATYTLLGINLLVYAAMFAYGPVPGMLHQHDLAGVLTASFNIDTLVRFGATNSQFVLAGQWWRLVTGTFVHITLLHIALNMWCLWNLGLFGEPLLGRRGLVVVYLVTGTAGMLLSFALAPANADVTVAGASGAVFGIAGILIVLLSNRGLAVPWNELRSLRRQVIFFAVANLAIGMAPGVLGMASPGQFAHLHLDPAILPHIDNSAHIGGFAVGLALGLPLFPRMTSGRSAYRARQRVTFTVAALLLCLLAYAVAKAKLA
jgi:rhomboid protease GluP